MVNWLLDHLWIELALLLVGICSVYFAYNTSRPVNLKAVLLPKTRGEVPEDCTWVDEELAELGFQWIGDFDASSHTNVATMVRFHASKDYLYHALLVAVANGIGDFIMVEFTTKLTAGGEVTTNNSPLPGIYSCRTEKIVVRAPWKSGIRDLFALHQKLCEAAISVGQSLSAVPLGQISQEVAASSKRDLDDEVKLGRLTLIAPDMYRTTLERFHQTCSAAVARCPANTTLSELRIATSFLITL